MDLPRALSLSRTGWLTGYNAVDNNTIIEPFGFLYVFFSMWQSSRDRAIEYSRVCPPVKRSAFSINIIIYLKWTFPVRNSFKSVIFVK